MSFTRNKIAAVLGATVAVAGLGAGVALGTGGGSSDPAATSVTAPAVTSTAPGTSETTAPETGAAEPASSDTDNVQAGTRRLPTAPLRRRTPPGAGPRRPTPTSPPAATRTRPARRSITSTRASSSDPA